MTLQGDISSGVGSTEMRCSMRLKTATTLTPVDEQQEHDDKSGEVKALKVADEDVSKGQSSG